jgi:hypothetical protein
LKVAILFLATLSTSVIAAQNAGPLLSGSVLDPAGRPVAEARIDVSSRSGAQFTAISGKDGLFSLLLPHAGFYSARAEASGFDPLVRDFDVDINSKPLTLQFLRLAARDEQVIVSADVGRISLATPDPTEKVTVREELLDANPGRPGAPVSLPGLPIETASGGIKAPQYFIPGVAGDHGEPIAQYIAVGNYLVPNNLSANAHGNGYADPNIFISAALGSVTTDGGAYNVLEGNHSLNLAATYSFRPQLKRFVTLTGDYRDLDMTAGMSPSSSINEWIALEAAYGNGLLDRLEHRQQYKWNATRIYTPATHEISLVSIGYYGTSYLSGLVPLGSGKSLHDTIDPRQRDQTHTALLAASNHGGSERTTKLRSERSFALTTWPSFQTSAKV